MMRNSRTDNQGSHCSNEEISELLISLISCQSPSGKEQAVISHLEHLLRDYSIPVKLQKVKQRSNLIAIRAPKKHPTLLLCSHADTVPPEGSMIWGVQNEVHNVKGLGACDAKGSIVAMLLAYREFAQRDIGKDVALAIFVGEEDTGDGGITFISEGYAPKYAIVGEPTEMTLPWGQAGYVHVSLRATCTPKHAFSLHGPDAMDLMITSIQKIREKIAKMGESLPDIERPNIFLQHLQGGSTDRFWYLRHECSASVVINIHPSWNAEQFISTLRKIIDKQSKDAVDASIRLSIASWDPGFEFFSSPLKNAVSEALALHNLPNPRTYMRSWTDAATLEWGGVKTVVMGPGSLQVAHSPNEYVTVNEIKVAAQVYKDSAIELLNGGGKQ